MSHWHVKVHYKFGVSSGGTNSYDIEADSKFEAEEKAKEREETQYPDHKVDRIENIYEKH